MAKIIVTGRDCEPGPGVKALNPQLFKPADKRCQMTVLDSSAPPYSQQALERSCKRIRQDSKPLLNKLEQRFYDDVICEKYLGSSPISIQAIRFRLGNGIWYKPDFFIWPTPIIRACPPIAIEVKGPHAFRGGFENLKIAASQYAWITWLLVWKQDGLWQEQMVLS